MLTGNKTIVPVMAVFLGILTVGLVVLTFAVAQYQGEELATDYIWSRLFPMFGTGATAILTGLLFLKL